MKTLPLSEAKARLSGLVAEVLATDGEVTITKNGRPAAVLVSPSEFDGWQETVAIRSDSALLREIEAGKRALKRRKAKLYSLDVLFKAPK